MIRSTRSLYHIAILSASMVLLILPFTLAGCGAPGPGAATPTPTRSATATATPPSCAFSVDVPVPQPSSGAFPPALGALGQQQADAAPSWTGLTMASADEGWALGQHYTPVWPIFLHYHSGTWSVVDISSTIGFNVLPGPLFDFTMVSPTEGWAVGAGGAILHYTGGQWRLAAAAGALSPYMRAQPYIYFRGYLSSVSLASATEGWAVGQGVKTGTGSASQDVPIFAHYSGGHWSVMDPAALGTTHIPQVVAMGSPSEGWALGAGLVAHYQQGTWHIDPAYTTNADWQKLQFTSIRMVSATEGWAVGDRNSGTNGYSGVIAHYCGGKWTLAGAANLARADALADTNLTSLTMVSPSEGWLTGVHLKGSLLGGFVLHYLNGRWQAVNLPLVTGCVPQAISMTSAANGWVVGTCYITTKAMLETFVLHYSNGAWSFYHG